MIRLQDIFVRFGAVQVLRGFDLQVAEGEWVALVGPSGSGKTTALRAINGLVELSSGEVRIRNRGLAAVPIAELRRQLGYVIQDVGLFPHWTVEENIGCVPRLLCWSRAERRSRARELIVQVGLETTHLTRLPSELSGGQRQRVGIARAMAARPEVLLMDEPFGAVDPLTRRRLTALLKQLREQTPTTTVLVTHDLHDAVQLADRIAVLRDGQLVQCDTPSRLLNNPADPWVKEFLGAGGQGADVLRKAVAASPGAPG